ncbi:hypothetical protein [Methylobacterium nigriterrae]|uniref:hypothetical protein n=1 Tax=Methylobacterium nigriterrae TaxID=3127512 RepID=UPI0030134D46
MKGEPLGTDYCEAKRRCDDVLNPQFAAWRTRDQAPISTEWVSVGMFDWMVAVYRSSPKYGRTEATACSALNVFRVRAFCSS